MNSYQAGVLASTTSVLAEPPPAARDAGPAQVSARSAPAGCAVLPHPAGIGDVLLVLVLVIGLLGRSRRAA